VLLGWLGWNWVLGGLVTAYLLTASARCIGVILRRYSFRTGQVPMVRRWVAVEVECGTWLGRSRSDQAKRRGNKFDGSYRALASARATRAVPR
jgi:hypothetical protein